MSAIKRKKAIRAHGKEPRISSAARKQLLENAGIEISGKPLRERIPSLVLAATCAICFSALALAAALLFAMHCKAADTEPSPKLDSAADPPLDSDGFPKVDWSYWQSVNPDVIGWITIPDTKIDLPIVQAPESDPQFYLSHDVYRNWNYLGCPYLDASCAEQGLEDSPNAVIFAHNLGYGDDAMFASIANYLDRGFMESHETIYIQTPESKMRFSAFGAICTAGSTETKRTGFESRCDFIDWIVERVSECQTVLRQPWQDTLQTLTLCTCSYYQLEDERTILFAGRR